MRHALFLIPFVLVGQALPPALNEATEFLRQGRNQDAIATLLRTSPKSPAVRRLLALAYLRQENYSAALDYAKQVTPADAPTLNVLGMAQLGLQDPAAAVRSFQQAIKLDPNLAEAHLQLGLLYTNQRQNLPEALRLLERALTLRPDLNGVHTAMGAALLESGKPAEAASELERAVQKDPQSTESWYQLSTAYKQLNRADAAADALARFSELSKKRAEDRAREMRGKAAYEQGVTLLNAEQYQKAFELFQQAAKEIPVPDAPYYRMAQILFLTGNDPASQKLIREAIRLNAAEPEYYFVLARSLQTTDKPAALAAVRAALFLRPGVPDFLELEAELLRH